MKTSEIIDGLEDLIQDRKSFVTPANDKFYGKDNPFKYDIAVLKAAIDKLSRRAEPENKARTLEQLRKMDGEPVYFTWDNIGWSKVVVIGGFPRIAVCVDRGNGYECHLYTPTDIDGHSYTYVRKPERSETP